MQTNLWSPVQGQHNYFPQTQLTWSCCSTQPKFSPMLSWSWSCQLHKMDKTRFQQKEMSGRKLDQTNRDDKLFTKLFVICWPIILIAIISLLSNLPVCLLKKYQTMQFYENIAREGTSMLKLSMPKSEKIHRSFSKDVKVSKYMLNNTILFEKFWIRETLNHLMHADSSTN